VAELDFCPLGGVQPFLTDIYYTEKYKLEKVQPFSPREGKKGVLPPGVLPKGVIHPKGVQLKEKAVLDVPDEHFA
jgi:hypothetical protein